MLSPIIIGLLASVIVMAPQIVQRWMTLNFPPGVLTSPITLLGVACVAMVLQRFVLDRRAGDRAYDGLADLMIHIHSPAHPDSPTRWTLRGGISFLLTLFGAPVGPEGAAAELTQALQMRARTASSRWLEQRRRTDAACALAASVSAAFGAPFAGILVPMELGIGGRNVSSVVASITAFLGIQYIMSSASLHAFDLSSALYDFRFEALPGVEALKQWGAIGAVAVVGGLIAVALIFFIRYSQESLLDLFQTQTWMRTLAGGVLLFLVALVYVTGHSSPSNLLEQVLWSQRSLQEVGLIFVMQLLSVALVLSAFGSVGVFWPIFALGGFVGYAMNHWMIPGSPSFSVVTGLAGGAAFWGAILGAPVAGSLVAFEMTRNFNLLAPCFLAGIVARELRFRLVRKTLIDRDLLARGVSIVEGRSREILESILVRDAMVTDHESVHEQEPVSELHSRLLKSRYQFLPVVNSQGLFTGLLTTDMVQEAWRNHEVATAKDQPLARLFEAKDLLYHVQFKVRPVKANDKLSVTAGLFQDIPCTPVVSDEGRVLGLLFAHSVRLAYERELARRSLMIEE